MKIIKKYRIRTKSVRDELILYVPNTESEMNSMFRFRYDQYLKHGYININDEGLDRDEYDINGMAYYFNIFSVKQKRILASVRLIISDPLPIIKDCFTFKEPLLVRAISKGKKCEISRLIVDAYDSEHFLPRNMLMLILVNAIQKYCHKNSIFFAYAFVKESLLLKLKKIFFPIFTIRKYRQKYRGSILKPYFSQASNVVIPAYFISPVLRIYLIVAWIIKVNPYIDAHN